MKPVPATLIRAMLLTACFLTFSATRAAEPPAPFPELQALLATEDEIAFLAGFCPFLEKQPAERLPELLDASEAGWKDAALSATHRATVREMVAIRRAVADPAGFLKTATPETAPAAALTSLRAWFARDREAALTAFRTRATDSNISAPFLTWLAETEPVLAFAELRRACPEPAQTAAIGRGAFEVWAARDAPAAWKAIDSLPAHAALTGLRSVTLAALGRRDEDAAFALWKALPESAKPDDTLAQWFLEWGSDPADRALRLARRVATISGWTAYGTSLDAGSHEATFNKLLVKAPPAMLEPALVGFFHLTDARSVTRLHRLHLLDRVPDAAVRAALVRQIVYQCSHTGLPLPRVLCAQLMARPPAEVLRGDPGLSISSLLSSLLTADPERGLAWLLRLDDPDWREFAPEIVIRWPWARLADFGPRLSGSANPREAELGRQLAEQWYETAAAAAFGYWLKTDPNWLAQPGQSYDLARNCQTDLAKADALADTLPEPAQRAAVHAGIDKWRQQYSPDIATTAELGKMLDQPAPDYAAATAQLLLLADRDLPAVDALMAKLPGDSVGPDELRAKRGAFHLSMGREHQAAAAWRAVRNDDVLFRWLAAINDDRAGPCGYEEIIALLTEKPPRMDRRHALAKFCRFQVAAGRAPALALAAATTNDEVRQLLIESLAQAARTPAHLAAVRRLAGEATAGTPEPWLVEALVRVDPAAAWREAVRLGPGSEIRRKLGGDSLVRMMKSCPAKVPEMVAEAPAIAFCNPSVTHQLIGGIAASYPVWTFHFAACWLPPEVAGTTLSLAAAAWARRDPAAACAACASLPDDDLRRKAMAPRHPPHRLFQLPDDALRRTAMAAPLGIWLRADSAAAMAWLGNDPKRIRVLVGDPSLLDSADPAQAAGFLLALPQDQFALTYQNTCPPVADRLAATDFSAAAAFLRDATARVNEAQVEPGFSHPLSEIATRTFESWLAADPPAARAFIATLPGLAPGPDAVENYLDGLKPLSPQIRFRRLATTQGVTAALARLPEDSTKSQALLGVLDAALRARDQAGIQAVLRATDQLGESRRQLSLGRVIAWDFLNRAPDDLLPWLRSLSGTPDADLLPDAALTAIHAAYEKPWLRPLAIEALRLLIDHPPADQKDLVQTARQALFLAGDQCRMAAEISGAVLDGKLPQSPLVEKLDQVVAALADHQPAAALPAAAALPSPDFDALLCRVIAAIPLAERPTALAALPPALRPRAAAWVRCLGTPVD